MMRSDVDSRDEWKLRIVSRADREHEHGDKRALKRQDEVLGETSVRAKRDIFPTG